MATPNPVPAMGGAAPGGPPGGGAPPAPMPDGPQPNAGAPNASPMMTPQAPQGDQIKAKMLAMNAFALLGRIVQLAGSNAKLGAPARSCMVMLAKSYGPFDQQLGQLSQTQRQAALARAAGPGSPGKAPPQPQPQPQPPAAGPPGAGAPGAAP